MKYYLIVGEKSGDLHASKVMRSLKEVDPEAEFRFYGGDKMIEQGGQLVRHHRDLAIFGIWHVIIKLRTILGYIKECKKDILAYQPDVVIGVDYSGFNLKIAEWASKNRIKYYHYIAPKTWAWREKRVHKIREHVDKMFCIFPFEVEYFKKFGIEVDFVGNPVLDAVLEHKPNANFITDNQLEDKPIIAVLPGSRKQEIERMLEFMLSVKKDFPDYQFVVGAVPTYAKDFYEEVSKKYDVAVVYDQTYDLLNHAYASISKSGTVTLETGLFNVPQVVTYISNWLNYLIASIVLPKRLKFVSLVNIVCDKQVAKELLYKSEVTPKRLAEELTKITSNEEYRTSVLNDYKKMREELGTGGTDKKIAKLVYEYLTA